MKYGNSFATLDHRLEKDYANPNELAAMDKQLHLCESLFGDWNARVCLLMQDPADIESLVNFHNKTGRPILSHSPSAQTNKRLVTWLSKHPEFRGLNIDGANAKDCGVFYANAIWYLKRGHGMGAILPQRSLAITESLPILRATFEQMPNLELIVAFGEVAYLSLKRLFALRESWNDAKKSKQLISANGYEIGITMHPKARGVPPSQLEARLNHLLQQWRERCLLAKNADD